MANFFGWDTGNHMLNKEAQLGASGGSDGPCEECGADSGVEVHLCHEFLLGADPVTDKGCAECPVEACKGRGWYHHCSVCGHLTRLED